MSRDRSQNSSGAFWGALAISVLVHLVIVLGFLPPQFSVYKPSKPSENEEFRVETIVEPREPEEQDEPEQAEELAEPDETAPEPEQPDQVVEKQNEERDERDELEKIDIDRKVVTQETNEESPEEANYLSQRANKTEEETRARETTTKEVDPGEPRENVEQPSVARGDPSEAPGATEERTEIARRTPTPRPEPKPTQEKPRPEPREESERQQPEAEQGVQKMERTPEQSPVVEDERPSAEELLNPNMQDYNEVFAETDEQHKERVERERNNRGRSILGDWREREKMVKAALENHITEVKPGNHTSVNAKGASYAQYINRIHRKIHARWGASFLPMLDTQYPMGHPLNNPNLQTTLEFVIESPSGTIESINIVQSSGELMYDAEALSISYTAGPHPNPPAEIVSPNGKVYVHWNFWRNQRQCGPFGASIYIVDNRRDRGG